MEDVNATSTNERFLNGEDFRTHGHARVLQSL